MPLAVASSLFSWAFLAQLWRIICDVFLMFFLDNLKSDCVLRTLFFNQMVYTYSSTDAGLQQYRGNVFTTNNIVVYCVVSVC